MPFTFSHAAIIAPFLVLPKRWYSVTALVVGSMGPDIEYYLRMRIKSDYSHTLAGIFWFDLPVCIVVAFLFHNLIRNSLIDNFPLFLKARFIRYKSFNWNTYFIKYWKVILPSFLTGIVSHILQDSFTHPGLYFTEHIAFLSQYVSIGKISIPVMKLVQHISSVGGILILLWLILRLPKEKGIHSTISYTYWVVVAGSTLLITGLRISTGLDYHKTGHLTVTLITAFFLSLIIAGYSHKKRFITSPGKKI